MLFAVIGGDERSVRLCRLLGRDGHSVLPVCLERSGIRCEPLSPGVLDGVDCAILPLPTLGTGGLLNAPLTDAAPCIRAVLGCLPSGCTVLAGRVDAAMWELARGLGMEIEDYSQREQFALRNAIATAEGALELLLRELPRTLCGSRVLICGAGRIGMILAHRLRALGAGVTVASRRAESRAICAAYGYSCADIRHLGAGAGGYDALVNTVPTPVISGAALSEVLPGGLFLELASSPGGFVEIPQGLIRAPGLPGRCAPESAAAYIRDTVYEVLRERMKV